MTTLNRSQVDIKAELEECFAELEEMGHQMMVDLAARHPNGANPYSWREAQTMLPVLLPIVQEKAKVLATLTELKKISIPDGRWPNDYPEAGVSDRTDPIVHYTEDVDEPDPVCGIDSDNITMDENPNCATCFACRNWLVMRGI